jgi:hypothetical protein
MYAMNIQNDVIGLVLRENCKSKQVTDFIARPADVTTRYVKFCHSMTWNQYILGYLLNLHITILLHTKFNYIYILRS